MEPSKKLFVVFSVLVGSFILCKPSLKLAKSLMISGMHVFGCVLFQKEVVCQVN